MGRLSSPRPMGPGEVLAVYQHGPLDGQNEVIELQHGVPPLERRIAGQTEPVTAIATKAELEQLANPRIGSYQATGGGRWFTTKAGQRVWVEAIYTWRGWL